MILVELPRGLTLWGLARFSQGLTALARPLQVWRKRSTKGSFRAHSASFAEPTDHPDCAWRVGRRHMHAMHRQSGMQALHARVLPLPFAVAHGLHACFRPSYVGRFESCLGQAAWLVETLHLHHLSLARKVLLENSQTQITQGGVKPFNRLNL